MAGRGEGLVTEQSDGGGAKKFDCKHFKGGQHLSANILRGQNLSATPSKNTIC